MADKNLSSIVRNAKVPSTAPIQPADVFVAFMSAYAFLALEDSFSFASYGITTFEPQMLVNYSVYVDGGGYGNPLIELQDNAITNVNAILQALDVTGVTDGTLDISGGTNAAPTGVGITAKASLVGKGWTVFTN